MWYAVVGIAFAALLLALAAMWYFHPLSDVTTDPSAPVQFIDSPTANPALNAYAASNGSIQAKCYPLIVPVYVQTIDPKPNLKAIFQLLEALASKTAGWVIHRTDAATHRIQVIASTPTPLCRQSTSDVVIQLRTDAERRVTLQMRSKSRVAAPSFTDFGANSHRIAAYFRGVELALRDATGRASAATATTTTK